MNNVLEREQVLSESIKELQKLNIQLAKLTRRKEELTETIISALGHDHEGQRSYEYDIWKIECKTPTVFSLDKKAYESGNVFIPDGFNPIRQSVSYTIDKRVCEQYMNEAPSNVRDALFQLITVKPGKASVTIKSRA